MVSPAPTFKLNPADERRLRQLVLDHFDFVWRTLQRVGVVEADLHDASQAVFSIVAAKISLISNGSEKSFIFGTSLRVASHARRSRHRKREEPLEEAAGLLDTAPNPEEALEHHQALQKLAEILDGMEEPMRAVFILFELEQLSMAEIASLEQVPMGTVASRLRRAREHFKLAATAQQQETEGGA